MNQNSFFERKKTIRCRQQLVSLERPLVMGILNITPDSFYDGGRYTNSDKILEHAQKMVDEGASIIDVGAVSTRPKAPKISVGQEIERLTPVLEMLKKKIPSTLISVDTYQSKVAEFVVKNFEVDIINDISAGTMDKNMIETVAKLQVPYIAMHIQGTPQTMQQNPVYDDVVFDIIKFFSERISLMKQAGIADIIIDPGFGFGKTIKHNFELLKRLDEFKIFELPLLVGLSRKSMIYKTLNTTPESALNGTTALNMVALLNGTNILRVHDVREAVETVAIFNKIHNS